MDIHQLLKIAYNLKASDIHLLAGYRPMLRIDGILDPIRERDVLTAHDIKEMLLSIFNPEQKDLYLTNKEIDFSLQTKEFGRFRINAYHERNNSAVSIRLLPKKIPSIEELNLPKIYHKFSELRSGFVLVTGPTGHGKSTTLAAIIEEINLNRKEHIVTIEDPVEYIHKGKESIISQRELHTDTHSWEIALRSVLREDPNVVLIGEMRDYETIAAALTTAETGHLVFATLHTNSAAQTLDRIVDVFPEHQQAQVRMQLSNTIEAVLSQLLLPALNGGRVPACEVLLATSAVKATIREGKTHLIDNIIQTSNELGMMTMEMSLAGWVKEGKISLETALNWSLRPEQLDRLIKSK